MSALTSRAIVFNGDETWELRELVVPDPLPGGAILRVEATGLCHSDIDHFRGHVHTSWGGEFPSIAGHEIVGRIHKIDAEATAKWGVVEGDRVAVRELVFLPDGRHKIYGHDFSANEGSGLGGGFADYLELLPGSSIYKIREDRTAAELTVFEPLSCAVTWVAPVKAGDVVVIEGPGHMGMASIIAARAAGASQIIVTGIAADAFRLNAALGIGADHVIDVESCDPVAQIRKCTDGRMADVVIDAAAGNPVTLNLAMEMVHKGGHVVVAGMKNGPLVGFHSDWIPTRRITLHPGAGLDTEGAVRLINEGKVPTEAMLGDAIGLERFEEAFDLLQRKIGGRDTVRVALTLT